MKTIIIVHFVNVSLLPEDSCTKAWRNCSTDWSSTERQPGKPWKTGEL